MGWVLHWPGKGVWSFTAFIRSLPFAQRNEISLKTIFSLEPDILFSQDKRKQERVLSCFLILKQKRMSLSEKRLKLLSPKTQVFPTDSQSIFSATVKECKAGKALVVTQRQPSHKVESQVQILVGMVSSNSEKQKVKKMFWRSIRPG